MKKHDSRIFVVEDETLPKIECLEKKYEIVYLGLYNKLEKNSLEPLEESCNFLRQNLAKAQDRFITRAENKQENDRLSANMKNLYELLVNHNHKQSPLEPSIDIDEICDCTVDLS